VASLDPCRLDPVASINRVRLGPDEARHLLSARALHALAVECGLRPDGPVRAYLDAVAAEAATAPAFAAVVQRFASRLTELLTVLRSRLRSARPEWDDTWWDRWAGVTTVWLGGGLAGGAFGAALAERCTIEGGRVEVAPDAAELPLVGAAALGRRSGRPALVLDFGHTSVKRAVVDRDSLRRLPPLLAPADDLPGAMVADRMVDVLRTSHDEAGRPAGPVVCAVASYTDGGQPVRTPLGTYARLADVSQDVQSWLGERLGTAVVLEHDGTAAARAVPADPRAVVVLLGTSLGVGFPDPCLHH
jgi:hypothetical protein